MTKEPHGEMVTTVVSQRHNSGFRSQLLCIVCSSPCIHEFSRSYKVSHSDFCRTENGVGGDLSVSKQKMKKMNDA